MSSVTSVEDVIARVSMCALHALAIVLRRALLPLDGGPISKHAQFILIHDATASIDLRRDSERSGLVSWTGTPDQCDESAKRLSTVLPIVTLSLVTSNFAFGDDLKSSPK
jgi:hypothetical protein